MQNNMNAWYTTLPALIHTPACVTLIVAHEYPSLLITFVLTSLKQQGRSITKLDVTPQTLSDIQLQLSSSFLGSNYTYWLSGVHELEAAECKQLIQFLSNYVGPHSVLFFLMPDERRALPSSITTITIPERLAYDDFIHLLMVYDARLKERSGVFKMVQQIFEQYQAITIEQAMLIMEYLPLLSKSAQEFMQQWLPRLMSGEQSLFALSQAFFAKNLSDCLHLWHQMREQYVDQFWTAYWSEQLFRAYHVVRALDMRDSTIDIKRISARLPYSFLKRDYKRWNVAQLLYAHQVITQIELDLKAGASSLQLDTFYMKAITL